MGKHIDKIDWDRTLGIKTLPVLVGERAARVATRTMMAGFYVLLVALAIARWLPWPALVALGGIHRLVPVWRTFSRPRPSAPPEPFAVWPLWFAAWAFVHARRAGALFVVGLAVGALLR